jgi:hypothetical protein
MERRRGADGESQAEGLTGSEMGAILKSEMKWEAQEVASNLHHQPVRCGASRAYLLAVWLHRQQPAQGE